MIHEPQHQLTFGDDGVIDRAAAFQFRQLLSARFGQLRGDEESVAGKDRFSEFYVVRAYEISETPAAALCQFQHQNAGYLSHRFQLQNPGHDRVAREVAGEKRFVDGDRFHADAFRLPLEPEDPIHHQERITMRQ